MHGQTHLVTFGTFEVDLASGELRKSGRRMALQEQPFRILVRLLESPGRVVTREELQRELWPDDTFVGFEQDSTPRCAGCARRWATRPTAPDLSRRCRGAATGSLHR